MYIYNLDITNTVHEDARHEETALAARRMDATDHPFAIAIEDVCDHLADFGRTAERDPGACEAKRITRRSGPTRQPVPREPQVLRADAVRQIRDVA